MNLGIIRITKRALLEALGLPDGTHIIGVCDHRFFDSDDIAIKVAHPELYSHHEGDSIPICTPKQGWK